MPKKILNLALILTSLIGYLEWGADRSAFLFQAEAELMMKALADPLAVLHPFTLIPVLGQSALLATLFQKDASKTLTYIGIAGLGLLLGFLFVIGLIGGNVKILGSSLPFVVLAIATVRSHRSTSQT